MVRLFVVTSGYKRISNYILKYYGLERYVHAVLTPDNIGCPEGVLLKNKNKLLAYGKRKYRVKTALLVDHNPDYISAAKKAGHLGYQVNLTRGLLKRDTEIVLDMVRDNKVDGVFFGMDDTLFDGHAYPRYIQTMLTKDCLNLRDMRVLVKYLY